jgi:nucleotide-binding universal stress UspA family protein
LFTDILVPISGEPRGWIALEQALALASWENDYVHGLHVVGTEDEMNNPRVLSITEEFKYRCQKARVPGNLVVEVGRPPRKICEFARWVDLVVLNVSYPPRTRPISKLASGLRTIIRRCCRPILAVPEVSPKVDRMLLAYDDSPKAREALFIATYIAGKWRQQLDILYVIENGIGAVRAHKSAKKYLKMRKVDANFITAKGDVAKAILKSAKEHKSL